MIEIPISKPFGVLKKDAYYEILSIVCAYGAFLGLFINVSIQSIYHPNCSISLLTNATVSFLPIK